MGIARVATSRHLALAVALICCSLVTAFFLLGTARRDQISSYVPTVSWDKVESQELQDSRSACAGRDVMRELEKKWGKTALRMTVAHGGSGARLQRTLRKFKETKRLMIGVIGGSITVGHGLEDDDARWSDLLAESLRRVYPDTDIQVHNGAVPATGTDYFASCYEYHVPKDSDLFIIESAVNDIVVETHGGDGEGGHKPDIVDYTERLIREMQGEAPDSSQLMLSTWIVPYDYTNGADRHAVVSEYYDIPRISMRSFLYSYLVQHPEELPPFFGNRNMDHPAQKGHEYMADIVLYHLLNQDCLMEQTEDRLSDLAGTGLDADLDPFTTPPLRIKQHFRDKPYANPRPFCKSTNVRDDDDVAQLQASVHEGWEETEWNGKHYWTSTVPGSKITFDDIDVHGGKLSLYYLRSDSMSLGSMRCWADSAEDKAVTLRGYWPYVSVGSTGFVAEGLAPGKHSVSCVVLEEKEDHGEHIGTNRVSIIAVLAS